MRKLLKHCWGEAQGQDEIVIVTTRQYQAVADDLLRKLFPEFDLRLSVYGSQNVTLFITDDNSQLH